jgi:hypothetical protein
VPLLIRLLEKENRFWAVQNIQDKNWWNAFNDPMRQTRQDSYCRIYDALCALAAFKDPISKGVIEETKKCWQTPLLDQQGQMMNECDAALAALREPGSSP